MSGCDNSQSSLLFPLSFDWPEIRSPIISLKMNGYNEFVVFPSSFFEISYFMHQPQKLALKGLMDIFFSFWKSSHPPINLHCI